MHATVVQVRRLVHFMPVYVKILKHIGHTHTHTHTCHMHRHGHNWFYVAISVLERLDLK